MPDESCLREPAMGGLLVVLRLGFVIQLRDLVAQEGVSFWQLFCRPREVQFLRHAHEVAQALQIHDRFIQDVF